MNASTETRKVPPARTRPRRRLALILGAVVILVFVALGASLCVRSFVVSVNQGRAAVDEFHSYYGSGDYAAIYDAGDSVLREGLALGEAVGRLAAMEEKLGRLVDKSFGCAETVGGTGTHGMRIEYSVKFEKAEGWETFDWRMEDGKMFLMAFAVEIGLSDNSKPEWELILAPTNVRPNDTTCSNDSIHWWEN